MNSDTLKVGDQVRPSTGIMLVVGRVKEVCGDACVIEWRTIYRPKRVLCVTKHNRDGTPKK